MSDQDHDNTEQKFPIIAIEQEMEQSYLDYAMSVIIGRALPDVRDGLKPVHRRVLYAMSILKNDYNKPYKKSARIVGDVIGKYHPHGDTAVYDTIVRMAQPFSMRNVLIDGQGNFGSIDGDSAAAMRYTEIRMSKLAHELLRDLDKETVDFIPNYDESELEPSVLSTRLPNLLVNGSSGIAVGMATNIPPHNLEEVINACLALIDDQNISTNALLEILPGPDFPTKGIINGTQGIQLAYETGKGKIYMRARAYFEGEESKSIIVNELPYQVNKARLISKIALLVKEKKIEGIVGLRDESDKDGMRMVIELRRGEVPEVILNNLYRLTEMQTVFGINMVVIHKNKPQLMSLKAVLNAFIDHRREVITRRCIFELNKAKNRAHILEGLSVALSNIDKIIAIIRAAANPAQAKAELMDKHWQAEVVVTLIGKRDAKDFRPHGLADNYGLQQLGYNLSPDQAQAILDLRLHRLTGLEKDKIFAEFNELLLEIKKLLDILQNPDQLMQVIKDELSTIAQDFATPRLSEIWTDKIDLSLEDLIAKEERVVTLSHSGYVKAQSLADYQSQRRGGKGKSATKMKDEDFVDQLFVANSHDTVLCFSSMGKVYWLKVYELPMASRNAKGKPIVNLLPLEKEESINAILPVKAYRDDLFVFMATSSGTVKKTALINFSRPRTNGIIALELRDGDKLIGVEITSSGDEILLFSQQGKSIHFIESNIRAVGRTAIGVRGIRLADGDQVVSLIVSNNDKNTILTATEFGYGKRTKLNEYRLQHRGGLGIISIKTSNRNGKVVGAISVSEEDEMMLISNTATLVRARVSEVSIVSRNTQGVRLINISQGERLVGLARIIEQAPIEQIE